MSRPDSLDRASAAMPATWLSMSQLYESLTLISSATSSGRADEVSQADAGQAIPFAERAGDDHVGMIGDQGDGMAARIGEIAVRLIDDQGAVERPGHRGDLLASHGRPRGTIGVGQVGELQPVEIESAGVERPVAGVGYNHRASVLERDQGRIEQVAR